MTKSNPKLILNLNIKDEELEKKIELAVDDYIDKNIDAILGEKIEARICAQVDKYFEDIKIDAPSYYKNYKIKEFQRDVNKKIDNLLNHMIDERILYNISCELKKILEANHE